MSDRYPMLEVETREQWRAWLADNHATAEGVWLVTFKKASGKPHLPYDDIVEEALAHGWVDSQPRKLDDERSQLLVTPRKAASNWSAANKRRIDRLSRAGLMTPAGEAAVEAAKANGAWTALDAVERLEEPGDLRTALDATPSAREHWDAFPPSARRGILEWIGNAKRAETRAKRIDETARLAGENVRANQWRQPKG